MSQHTPPVGGKYILTRDHPVGEVLIPTFRATGGCIIIREFIGLHALPPAKTLGEKLVGVLLFVCGKCLGRVVPLGKFFTEADFATSRRRWI